MNMTNKTVSSLLASCLFVGSLATHAAPANNKLPATPALDIARQLNDAFIQVADKVSPAVVVITVVQKPGAQDFDEDNPLWDMLPPDLRRRFQEEHRERYQQDPRFRPSGRGSGIVISEDGYILTNNHVLEEAEKITVRFKDSKEYPAEIKGRDPQSDLAVIKIDAKGLIAAKLGDSTAARPGEFVVAIGAPFDLDYTVTVGHISAKGRAFREIAMQLGPYADQDFIQTDASINPGNSGGPLVNLYGEVIGINTMIRGIGTGIGFAVPSNIARNVAENLIKTGKFTRSRIGVAINDLRENQDYKSQVPNLDDGVIIDQIMPDGPAAESDLKAGDIVVSVDGHATKTSRELKEQISYKQPGQSVTLDVVRPGSGGKTRNLKVKVKTEEIPAEEAVATSRRSATAAAESSDFGMTVRALTKELAEEYDLDMTSGIIVTEVEPNSVAAEKGIRPGDVITEVNYAPVTSLKQFRELLKSADRKKGVIINFNSQGTTRFTVLKESK
jgi:serine protease Do